MSLKFRQTISRFTMYRGEYLKYTVNFPYNVTFLPTIEERRFQHLFYATQCWIENGTRKINPHSLINKHKILFQKMNSRFR